MDTQQDKKQDLSKGGLALSEPTAIHYGFFVGAAVSFVCRWVAGLDLKGEHMSLASTGFQSTPRCTDCAESCNVATVVL